MSPGAAECKCFGGPMDGSTVPVDLVRGGAFESGIRGISRLTAVGKFEMRESVNEWANGNGHFRVRYRLEGDVLRYDGYLN